MTRSTRVSLVLAVVAVIGVATCTGDAPPRLPVDARDGVDAGPRDAGVQAADAGPAACPDGGGGACPPRGHATWPMPNPPALALPNPGSIEARGEIALDRVTGLVWQRTFAEKLTWHAAQAFCDSLQLGGADDWRVPSRIELVSIVDFTRTPTTDNQAFGDTPIDYFWAASPVPFIADHAYSVYFGAGLTEFARMDGASAYVRCVRGGRPGAAARFHVNGDETIDLNTGLRWQRGMGNEPVTWEAAELYCQMLTLAGSSRWRLPSPKEMQTIVDETRTDPLIDLAIFPGTPAGKFWTGGAVNRGNLLAMTYLDFSEGVTADAGDSELMHVRCVR